MIALSLLLALVAQASPRSSSAALYEFLASKGYENWRTNEGGYIQMQSFSCNSTYLKDLKLQMYQCWYAAAKNGCRVNDTTTESDDKIAKPLFEAMSKMGLPILATDSPTEKWSQIDADNLGCMLSIDHTTEPATKRYTCSAMTKLKN